MRLHAEGAITLSPRHTRLVVHRGMSSWSAGWDRYTTRDGVFWCVWFRNRLGKGPSFLHALWRFLRASPDTA